MQDYIEDKQSYHVTKVIFKAVVNPSTTTTTSGKFARYQKRIRESFCLHLGHSQYMSGDYYLEFGEVI